MGRSTSTRTYGFNSENGIAEAIYWPLYVEAPVYQAGRHPDIRPLSMWMENVEKDGKTVPRFAKITDESVIAKLQEIKRQMYGR